MKRVRVTKIQSISMHCPIVVGDCRAFNCMLHVPEGGGLDKDGKETYSTDDIIEPYFSCGATV